jgi:hypothetical protein
VVGACPALSFRIVISALCVHRQLADELTNVGTWDSPKEELDGTPKRGFVSATGRRLTQWARFSVCRVRAGPAARDAWLAQRMRIERSVQAELRSTGQLLCCMSHHVPHTTLAAPAPAATDMQSCVAALLARNQEMQRLLVS